MGTNSMGLAAGEAYSYEARPKVEWDTGSAMRKVTIISIIMGAMLFINGCGGKTTSADYLREETDYSYIQQVGVLPFTNTTADELAGTRARDLTITHILALGLFDTVDKGIVDSVMTDEALTPGEAIDPMSLRRLGQRMRVQAFMLGTIDLAQDNRIGTVAFPQVAITLRLVDANTGMILWQASGSRSGDSWTARLFGITPDDHYEITDKLIRYMLQSAPASE